MEGEENPEIKAKFDKLAELTSEINKISLKLDRFKAKKEHDLVLISYLKWRYNLANHVGDGSIKKEWRMDIEKLASAKRTRTFVGLCSEELMKMLFKLDQVQSMGIMDIKQKRRGLVARINNELLPKCDAYLVEAQAVVTLYNKVRRLIETENVVKMNNGEESNKTAAEQKSNNNDDSDSDDGNESSSSDDGGDVNHEVKRPFPEQNPSLSPRLKPEYELVNTDEAAIVKLMLPADEEANELRFQVNGYDGELTVHGRNFQLPFQVNTDNYILDDTRVKIVASNEVQIKIPRRKYSHINERRPMFNQRQHPAYGYRERPRQSYFQNYPDRNSRFPAFGWY